MLGGHEYLIIDQQARLIEEGTDYLFWKKKNKVPFVEVKGLKLKKMKRTVSMGTRATSIDADKDYYKGYLIYTDKKGKHKGILLASSFYSTNVSHVLNKVSQKWGLEIRKE